MNYKWTTTKNDDTIIKEFGEDEATEAFDAFEEEAEKLRKEFYKKLEEVIKDENSDVIEATWKYSPNFAASYRINDTREEIVIGLTGSCVREVNK